MRRLIAVVADKVFSRNSKLFFVGSIATARVGVVVPFWVIGAEQDFVLET